MKVILSRPTMCLHCHMIVIMTKGEDAWVCGKCGHIYPFTHWKIREDLERRPKA